MRSRVVPFPVRSQTTAGPGRPAMTQTAKSSSLLTIAVSLSRHRSHRSFRTLAEPEVENMLAVVSRAPRANRPSVSVGWYRSEIATGDQAAPISTGWSSCREA